MKHVLTRAGDGGRVIITRRACRRPLLNCVHIRRVIITFLGCQMLFGGSVDGHLNLIKRSRCGVCLPGPRECKLAHFGVHIFTKSTSVPLSGEEKESSEITYKPGAL